MVEMAGNNLLIHRALEQATCRGGIKTALEMDRTRGEREDVESSLLLLQLQLSATGEI